MKISINALDPKSVDRAIRQLESYANDLERKAQELCRRLGGTGYTIASDGFDGAIYDGTNDVTVELIPEENKMVLKASGYTVLFIEFGTGVTYQTYHPKRSAMDMDLEIGGYGHGLGKLNGGWRYQAEKGAGTYGEEDPDHPGYIHTYGNPANMPMYNASKDIRGEMLRIAREVFRS